MFVRSSVCVCMHCWGFKPTATGVSREGPMGKLPGMYWDVAKQKYFRNIAGQPPPRDHTSGSEVTAYRVECERLLQSPLRTRAVCSTRTCRSVPTIDVLRRRHAGSVTATEVFRCSQRMMWHALLQHDYTRGNIAQVLPLSVYVYYVLHVQSPHAM